MKYLFIALGIGIAEIFAGIIIGIYFGFDYKGAWIHPLLGGLLGISIIFAIIGFIKYSSKEGK